MNELADNLSDARRLAEIMLSHVEQAIAATDVAETQMYLRQAMSAGEEMEILLADSAYDAEDHTVANQIESGLSALRKFFRLGVQALSGDQNILKDKIHEMRPVALEAIEHIQAAGAPIGPSESP